MLTPRFPAGFALRAGEKFGTHLRAAGWGESCFVAPAADNFPDEHQRDQRDCDGHDPGEQIETFFRRLDQDCGAVLFDEGLEDLVVGLVASHVRVEIFLHAAGGFAGTGERAAGVIAHSGGVFAAAAHAEDALAEGLGTRSLLGSCGRRGTGC